MIRYNIINNNIINNTKYCVSCLRCFKTSFLCSFLHLCKLLKRTCVVWVVKQSIYRYMLQQQCDTMFLQFFLASTFMFSPGVKTSGNFCKTFSPANTTWKYVCRITLAVSNLFLSFVNFVVKYHYTRLILFFFLSSFTKIYFIYIILY